MASQHEAVGRKGAEEEPAELIVSPAWAAHVRELALIVPAVEKQMPSVLARVAAYATQGYTLADLAAAVETFYDPEVQAKLEFPDSFLPIFARAILKARREREAAERAARQRREAAEWQEWRRVREAAVKRLAAGHKPETDHEKAVALLRDVAASFSMQGE